MNQNPIFKPEYEQSWALVIGINKYQFATPLGYARHDAEAFREILINQFDFPSDNVLALFDAEATRDKIRSAYLSFASESVLPDSRLVVFFAGHGHTRSGNRGEIGYLVPVDGIADDLSTLIRWDELTRNAEVIPAKHILFIMDACYGGLAIHRTIREGSSRFCRDMLQRLTRQVLTAGKADETVADSGGPRPNHSIFTGHLLDALEGKAADSSGIISANGVMNYVYSRVSNDPYSNQTPHFGFFEGDGDFMFAHPPLTEVDGEGMQQERNLLMSIPFVQPTPGRSSDERADLEQLKDFLSDSRYRIRLDDLVTSELRRTMADLGIDRFPVQGAPTFQEMFDRMREYEKAISQLNQMVILIARWADSGQQPLLAKIFGRLTDMNDAQPGSGGLNRLRWYPILFLLYSAGVSALSVENYDSLGTLLNTTSGSRITGEKPRTVAELTVESIIELDQHEFFKKMPGYERYYVPRSEYLFQVIQAQLDDLLFLGKSYETIFDRFEIFIALVHADRRESHFGIRGPVGRFGWKRGFGPSGNPFKDFVEESERSGERWAPLRSGFFEGSIDRFKEVSSSYKTEILDRLNWI